VTFFFALCLQYFEDEILLAQSAGTGQFLGSCDLGQLGDVLFFQFSYGHVSPKPAPLRRSKPQRCREIFKRRVFLRKTKTIAEAGLAGLL
jgi:hypothetical protein